MFIAKIGAALFAGVLIATTAAPSAQAASLVTEAFLANVRPNVDFLARSSEIVAARTTHVPTRTFARDAAPEAIKLAAAIDAADAGARVASLTSPDAATSSMLATGRSVAIEGSVMPTTPAVALGEAANGRAPLGWRDGVALTKLSGRDLDDAYWAKQLDALSQLEADYRTYIVSGDDPALVALSKRELPKVMRRIGLLSRI